MQAAGIAVAGARNFQPAPRQPESNKLLQCCDLPISNTKVLIILQCLRKNHF